MSSKTFCTLILSEFVLVGSWSKPLPLSSADADVAADTTFSGRRSSIVSAGVSAGSGNMAGVSAGSGRVVRLATMIPADAGLALQGIGLLSINCIKLKC